LEPSQPGIGCRQFSLKRNTLQQHVCQLVAALYAP